MVTSGVLESVFGLFPLSDFDTTLAGLELIENLTDITTPQFRSRMATRSVFKNLLAVLRQNVQRNEQDQLLLLPAFLNLLERIVGLPRANATIYRCFEHISSAIITVRSLLKSYPEKDNNVKYSSNKKKFCEIRLQFIEGEVAKIEKVHNNSFRV